MHIHYVEGWGKMQNKVIILRGLTYYHFAEIRIEQ